MTEENKKDVVEETTKETNEKAEDYEQLDLDAFLGVSEEKEEAKEKQENVEKTQELSAQDIEELKSRTMKNQDDKGEEPEEDDEYDYEYEDDDYDDDYYDDYEEEDDYKLERANKVLTILLGFIIIMIVALAGVMGYRMVSSHNENKTNEKTVETTTTPTATSESHDFTSYETQTILTAVKTKLTQLYNNGEYFVPIASEMTLTGDSEAPTAKLVLSLADHSKKDATFNLVKNSSGGYDVTSVNINGETEDVLVAKKGTNSTATPNATETPKATKETETADPSAMLKSESFEVYLDNSITVQLDVVAGKAEVYAEAEDGTTTLLASQDDTGTAKQTVELSGYYTIYVNAQSGSNWHLNYELN